jgi:hypothetical protein
MTESLGDLLEQSSNGKEPKVLPDETTRHGCFGRWGRVHLPGCWFGWKGNYAGCEVGKKKLKANTLNRRFPLKKMLTRTGKWRILIYFLYDLQIFHLDQT